MSPNSFEPNYVVKNLQMQNPHFTPVNSPNATATKEVNRYSRWKSELIHWTGLFCGVMWLRKVKLIILCEMNSYNLVDIYTSLHKFASSLSKLHCVTRYKTVTFTVTVLSLITLHTAKCV
jgi:hypothetical protein